MFAHHLSPSFTLLVLGKTRVAALKQSRQTIRSTDPPEAVISDRLQPVIKSSLETGRYSGFGIAFRRRLDRSAPKHFPGSTTTKLRVTSVKIAHGTQL